ncbi:MAG: hypothetical protein CMH48_03140 [Muricauda sp.]|uniref:Alkyl hydroperoxide reductase subunit C/ Thiol specific antioxidant domain-containing protein n=2 Tax=Flagellimonas lutaonensis TaxID=516051 RepID=A0A0D5YWI0_9FLAO|nr:hypothetical protein VC82_2652 [Allomuricauda lutaonensis]MBC29817.1 hypothetical protein [Allomuricauda sp.]
MISVYLDLGTTFTNKNKMLSKVKILVIVGIVILGNLTYGQDKQFGFHYSITEIDQNFDVDKVFYKDTGRKITKRTFSELIRKNPNLYLEKEIDEHGNVVRYFYDPKNQVANNTPNARNELIEKGNFPNFKMTTIDQTKIDLKELKGKLVILRFELCANDFRFKKHEIQKLDEKINALANKKSVKSIIVFQCNKNEVRKGFDLKNSNFELVANGQNFIEKYGITRFPSTLLLDQNGNFIEKYSYSEDIDLEEFLKN